MAFRYEKETGDLVITFPGGEGIAPDPYSGVNRYYAVNLEVPNEVSVGYPITSATTSGGTLGVPVARSTSWFASYGSAVGNGSPARYAILDGNGIVWEATSYTGTWTALTNGNSTTGSSTRDGLAYFLGYLFKFRNDKIDYWDGTMWTTGWQSIAAGVKHFAYVASDNILYFTNGNYVGAISLTDPSTPTSFDPANSGTYSFTTTKLQLPQNDWAVSIGEVGGGNTPQSTLLVGGIQNAIYPWDKTSASFNYPIFMADTYAANIVSANQNAFIFAGKNNGRGRIYITNGAQAEEFFKMPDYVFGVQDPYYDWGDAIFHRNNLIFGAFVVPNSQATPLLVSQLWALDLKTNAFRSLSNINASSAAGNATALIASPNTGTSGFSLIVGWRDTASPAVCGIGYMGSTAGVGSAVITTDLIPVGTFLRKKTFKQVELKFRTALASGESVTVTPIADGTNTANLTFSPSMSAAGNFSAVANVTFQASQWLQFQLSMSGNSAMSGCRLHEIRVR